MKRWHRMLFYDPYKTFFYKIILLIIFNLKLLLIILYIMKYEWSCGLIFQMKYIFDNNNN